MATANPSVLKPIQSASEPTSGLKGLKQEYLSHLYIMFYRHGMNANLTKGFFCDGDLIAATRRAREHCKIMNYHFIFVRPMVCDLDLEESYKLRGAEGEMIA